MSASKSLSTNLSARIADIMNRDGDSTQTTNWHGDTRSGRLHELVFTRAASIAVTIAFTVTHSGIGAAALRCAGRTDRNPRRPDRFFASRERAVQSGFDDET